MFRLKITKCLELMKFRWTLHYDTGYASYTFKGVSDDISAARTQAQRIKDNIAQHLDGADEVYLEDF